MANISMLRNGKTKAYEDILEYRKNNNLLL